MAGVESRRASASLALAGVVLMLLTACFPIPFLAEGGNGMNTIDTEAIATAVTATSGSIEKTTVESSIDGTTRRLWIAPQVGPEGLTATELDAVLRVAYEMSAGQVSAIEVHTIDATEASIDIKAAAAELGIEHLSHQNSVTYSTVYLAEAYGE